MVTIGAVVLSYGKAHSFEPFWRSLQGQTRPPDEIVVVDDGSPDGTLALARSLAGNWPVFQTNRLGQSAARNYGLGMLGTDLVIFLDGDLVLQCNMLARMEQELADHPGAHFVYSHYDRTGAVTGRVAARPWSVADLKRGNFVSPMSLVRRLDLPCPCFDEDLERYEDWDLWLRMGKAGKVGLLIDEVLFTAYYRPGDLSSAGEHRDFFLAVKQKHGIV